MGVEIRVGDCREVLQSLPDESVALCVSSPPYLNLRDYKVAGQIGLEATPDAYVAELVAVFREVRRVLKPTGCLVLNLGDSYVGSGKGPSNSIQNPASQIGPSARNPAQFAHGQAPTAWVPVPAGYKPKDLYEIPSDVARALRADGWWLRSRIPWLKRNSLPESVKDRPSSAVEYLFLLPKSERYTWHGDRLRVEGPEWSGLSGTFQRPNSKRKESLVRGMPGTHRPDRIAGQLEPGRNRRNTDWFFESWQGLLLDEADDPLALIVNPVPFREEHFAVFPPKLVEPFILACTDPGDVVLDPFCGAGTVGLVASRHGRSFIGCELNPEYAAIARRRIAQDAPLFSGVAVEAPAARVVDKQAASGLRTYAGFNERWDAKERGAA